MSEYLKIVLPALIGLIGTLIAVFIGYRQWKRQPGCSVWYFSYRTANGIQGIMGKA
ncbi:MAG: hypothetical protein ABR568_06515 [Pyrinomonadaceae bacterium]